MAFALTTLIILIIVNAFFAASEMALVSLNDNKVKRMAEDGDKKAKMLYKLISQPSQFLSTIQIGITLAGFLASAFAADFFAGPLAELLYNLGVPLSMNVLGTASVVVITILLSYFTLVFGELVPKQLALQKSETISNFAVTPLTWLFKICLPLVKFLTFSTNTVVRLFGVDPNAKNEEATEEEIRMMVDVGGEQGTIQITEKLMINNIFEFNDKIVSDIFTHRTDMSVLSIDATLQETVKLVNLEKYTRFPVYEGDVDNIVGILHVKDLFQFIDQDNDNEFDLKNLIRKPYFVLETQSIDVLFTVMQKNNVHIAIVVDEYGGTEGLITIEDVIEEIVGEIFSESDGPEDEEVKQLATNKFSISGITHLYKLEDILHIDFPTDDYDTLSGFLIGEIGYIPSNEARPVITYKNLVFEVTEVSENRIENVIVTMLNKEQNELIEEKQ
ncbi:hemolysin family protein [Metabacillus niabensis]|uniref:Hemolysin n=1 Tax=Metabacillus niabensis TaxID=324854 RepID=A0ABT9Z5D0_9BACI|nr:hemolysin family protein [Metabacillus niabensis]MDQ0226475.1 putative hemolysin [Metabacillus niabensis]PAD68884.1 hemolysin [Bacillus sp. 7586-K]